MDCLSASLIAKRLDNIIADSFKFKEYDNDIYYVESHLLEDEETTESIVHQYSDTLRAFVEVSSCFLRNNRQMWYLVLISDPYVIYAFNAVVQNSIRILEGEGTTRTYNVPNAEKAFYKKFALLSMRFRKEFENLF